MFLEWNDVMGVSKKENIKLKEMELIKPNGVIMSKSIYDKKSALRWIYRDEQINEIDSGWRVFGDTNDKNLIITDIKTLTKIVPIFDKIKDYPIGTDLEYHLDDAGHFFTNTKTGERLWL